jgi:hypothetical protein
MVGWVEPDGLPRKPKHWGFCFAVYVSVSVYLAVHVANLKLDCPDKEGTIIWWDGFFAAYILSRV